MGNHNSVSVDNGEDAKVVYEVIEKDINKELEYELSITKNELTCKNRDNLKLQEEFKDLNKENIELKKKIKLLQNMDSIKSNELNKLKEKCDNMEYSKLDYEEKYLTCIDYKETYNELFEKNVKTEDQLSEYVSSCNTLQMSNDNLTKQNNYLEKINKSNTSKIENLNSKNKHIKQDMLKQIDEIYNSKKVKLYNYIESNFSLEPYVIYSIMNNVYLTISSEFNKFNKK